MVLAFTVSVLMCCTGCEFIKSESNYVVVTYDANGGSVSSLSENVPKGDSVSLPKPSRRSHVFMGWYTALDDGILVGVDGDDIVVETNVILYAQWASGVTVYYNTSEGSVSPVSETVFIGDAVTLPTPIRIGYTFAGWCNRYGIKVGAAGDIYIVNGDVVFLGGLIETLHAEWRLDVTVMFNMSGGDTSLPSIMVPAGSSITLPAPTRSGYIFNGWYTSIAGATKAGDAGDSFVVPDGRATMELYARWSSGEVMVTYNANGGNVLPSSEIVSAGSTVILPVPIRSGYIFNGWFTAISGGTQVGKADGIYVAVTNVTLYAQWIQ